MTERIYCQTRHCLTELKKDARGYSCAVCGAQYDKKLKKLCLKVIKRHDVPQDIADLANDDGCLDDLVHEAKSHEASVINNRGFWEQLDYLLETKSANWNSIRRAIGMEDA